MSTFGVAERFSWARSRQTQRKEDEVYSLLGIFNVYLAPLYGEGIDSALRRLQQELNRSGTYGGIGAFDDLKFV
jgi:hypothetical protein